MTSILCSKRCVRFDDQVTGGQIVEAKIELYMKVGIMMN
jgi:hypothetical protein